jgi:sec-independent protein translocase protein TatB
VFDIGFTELLLCLVVALVVIGPEQLPSTVRTVGLWIGRMKRSLRDTRNEIERQIGADDIRRQLHNEEVMQNIEEARIRFEKTILEAEQYEDAETEARRQARQAQNYGPPDELPDHAHGSDASANNSTDNNKPAAATVTQQPNAAASANNNAAAGNNNSAATATPATANTNQTANAPAPSGTGH